MSRSRIALLATAGALALLVVVSLVFVPRGGGDNATRGALDSSTLATAQTAGLGRLTPAMRSEIRQVVAAGSSEALPRLAPGVLSRVAVQDLVRCADFDGQRYCLGAGWTDRTPAQVQQSVLAGATTSARRAPVENTGDLSPAGALARLAAMSPAARAREETQELTMAARSVAKVWLLRHDIQGVPLPPNFLQEHPEAAATPAAARITTSKASRGRRPGYPRTAWILTRKWATQQNRTYWCGVATTQMIVSNWVHHARSQAHWARELHTTTDGTATSDIVRVINHNTGYDNARHAGPYIVLDVSDWTFRQWYRLIVKHISVYHAPVVLNPVLLKKFYPYLDHDESGHFQVGRGYSHPKGKVAMLGYYEPWNPQHFDPSRPFIARVQWRQALKSYEATEAHFAQDIGV